MNSDTQNKLIKIHPNLMLTSHLGKNVSHLCLTTILITIKLLLNYAPQKPYIGACCGETKIFLGLTFLISNAVILYVRLSL